MTTQSLHDQNQWDVEIHVNWRDTEWAALSKGYTDLEVAKKSALDLARVWGSRTRVRNWRTGEVVA